MADVIDYKIIGNEMQLIEIELDQERRKGRSRCYDVHGTRHQNGNFYGWNL